MYVDYTPEFIARFWSRVNRSADCWEWTGALDKDGYGQFTKHLAGEFQSFKAHRVAWQITTGEVLTSAIHICHTCDNRRCVRPDDDGTYRVNGIALPRHGHLYRGTYAINMDDRTAKERTNSILKAADVRSIKALLTRGDRQTDVARSFGVSKSTVHLIANGKAWRHIT